MKNILVLIYIVAAFTFVNAAAHQIENIWNVVIDNNGNPLTAGYVYVYEAGTSNLATIWEDKDKTTPASNPINLDAYGRKLRFADGQVKLVYTDSDGVTIETYDGLTYGPPTSFSNTGEVVVTFTGDANDSYIKFDSQTTDDYIIGTTTTASQSFVIRNHTDSLNEMIFLGDGNIIIADTKYIASDIFRAIDNTGLSLQDDGGNGIYIEDGGQIGIGTSGPDYRLHVKQSSSTPICTFPSYSSPKTANIKLPKISGFSNVE